MAISSWWPLRLFGKDLSSPPNFVHLSRSNIERMKELLLRLEPLNPHQCRSISRKLERTMQSVERIVDSVDDISLLFGSAALENFYRVSEKGRQLVEECCKADWWQASAFQIQNEEAFKEILLEAGLSYNTIFQVVQDVNKKESLCEDLRETTTFDPSGADEVYEDRVALKNRLDGFLYDANFSIRSQWLGQYLLRRVSYVLQSSSDADCDVRSFNQWPIGKSPDGEWGVDCFLGGNVCKTTWLDVPCAKKVFGDEGCEEEWLAEAQILASLNHPNIVKFLNCNKYRDKHSGGHFIAMEQMETSLATFIKRLKEEKAKPSLFLAVDIILQIAHGLCYLHDYGIAHRDLKTSNVVVRKVTGPHHQYNLEVKLADFGISKVKLKAGKSNTITRPKIGTTVYMPPEAFTNGRADWFKADVYSFSVMCSVILSCHEPFQDVKRSDVYGVICSGQRPELPGDTPKELADVIKEGWATDRKLRPSILDICSRLEKLRHGLLRNHGTSSHVRQEDSRGSDAYIDRMLKKRSESRERDWSHARLQALTNGVDEEEWFDGDEEQKTAVQVQITTLQVKEDSSWLAHDSRQRSVKRIMDTLERHMPFAGQDSVDELLKIARRYEAKIFQAATDQQDYLRKISLKMLSIETKANGNPLEARHPPGAPGAAQAALKPVDQAFVGSSAHSGPTGAAAGTEDQRELVWTKLQLLKEKYLEDANELYGFLLSNITQPMPAEQLKKLKHYKDVLHRMIPYLRVAKDRVPKEFNRDKVDAFERNLVTTMTTLKKGQQPQPAAPGGPAAPGQAPPAPQAPAQSANNMAQAP